MEFRFNLKKRHVFAIMGMIFFVGMVIAYGSTQPPSVMGHTTGELFIQGLSAQGISDQLFNPVFGWMHQQVTAHDTRIANLENKAWTPLNPAITSDYLCWPNGSGVCSPGLTGGTYTGAVPPSAKEFLVYVAIYTGTTPPPGSGADPAYFEVYTQEGSTKYAHRILAAGPNSQTFWLPVTSDNQLYRNLVGGSMSNANTRVRILGYR